MAESKGKHLGEWLRSLRAARQLPLRVVAAAAEMDSTLLSKIELNQRLPTSAQAMALAAFFKVPFKDFEARRIATKFWQDFGKSSAAPHAALLIQEQAASYKAKGRNKTK
jgi:transcriptional regulator with XRE-family HTH domain